MFKFVVLCAFVASAVAEPKPGVLLSSPWVQPYAAYSTVVSPASTSISSQSSSVIHPSPLTYSTPVAFSHLIKKRSAQVLVPSYTPYSYLSNYPSVPVVASPSIVQSPVTYSSVQLPLATHFIKKRSAPLLTTSWTNTPTTYLANPALSTPLISGPLYQSPYYSGPLVNTHFIKKRSAEPQAFLPASYYGPSTYINTIATTPYLSNPLIPNFYSTPAGIPLATTHFIKKRSAEASPEPAAAPAADPQLAFAAYPTTTYFGGASLIPSYPSYSTVIKSAPIIATNPVVYSSFIKK